MGQTPSSAKDFVPIVMPLIKTPSLDESFTSDMIAYESVVICEDGSSHKALYFPDFKAHYYMYSGKIYIRCSIWSDLKSKKVRVKREDALKFQTAYLVYKESCAKLEATCEAFTSYVKEPEQKL
jgi:hypothetical protein